MPAKEFSIKADNAELYPGWGAADASRADGAGLLVTEKEIGSETVKEFSIKADNAELYPGWGAADASRADGVGLLMTEKEIESQ